LWLGSYKITQVVNLTLRYLWRGVSTVAQAMRLALRYTSMAAFAIPRYLSLGASTAALGLGWPLGYLWQGVLIIFQGLSKSPFLVTRTVWSGYTVVPALWKAGVWVAKNRKGYPQCRTST